MELRDSNLLKQKAFIDGDWIGLNNSFNVLDPFNQSLVGTVPNCGLDELESAITASHRSFPAWSSQSANFRSEILMKWYHLLLENLEDLALILSTEMGKTLKEAKAEIEYGADYIKWFAEEALRVYGDTIPSKNKDQRLIVIKQAIGPTAIITPWNFPNAMIARKVGPALAAGCTVVIKPAEDTPLSALAMAYLGQKAGIPKGVLNIVTTSDAPAIGKALCEDPRIKKLSFTGSTAVGKILSKQCSGTLKKLSMELGGNASFIVFDDANLDHALSGLMASKFRNSGQTCVCSNRVFIHEDIYVDFVPKLKARVESLKLGRGTDAGISITPLINKKAAQKVQELLSDALAKGAELLCGAELRSDLGPNFITPGILLHAKPEMRIFTEEIFGPLVAIYTFKDDKELMEMANDTEHGLASYFYSENPNRIWQIAEALECGMVGINTGLISNVSAPFGGVKQSGYGREGSKYGMEEYMNMKYLNWQLN